ncbi:MAG TPA: hypothetical protein EYP22_00610 [Methanosarcinales archaeon]|nr:hypothetical protein [Methanosarcinales archaeon]
MGLLDKVMKYIEKTMKTAEKDNILIVAIHEIVQEEGWIPTKTYFGADEHEMEYKKSGSPLKKLEIEAERVGNSLKIEFEGKKHKSSGISGLIEDALDLDEKELHAHLDLHRYVTDDMQIINESELREFVKSHIELLERHAREII